ncbi:hypothetical protein GLYMA_09G056950v4 [Glycine max]|nr:hypothetical protein GLYMA_09G056950v4 [Glycine max]
MFYLRPVLKSKLSGNYVRIVQSVYSESRQRTLDRAYDEIKYLSFGLGVNDERMAEQALTFYKITVLSTCSRRKTTTYEWLLIFLHQCWRKQRCRNQIFLHRC